MDYTEQLNQIISNQEIIISQLNPSFFVGLVIGAVIGLTFWLVAKGVA